MKRASFLLDSLIEMKIPEENVTETVKRRFPVFSLSPSLHLLLSLVSHDVVTFSFFLDDDSSISLPLIVIK